MASPLGVACRNHQRPRFAVALECCVVLPVRPSHYLVGWMQKDAYTLHLWW